MRWRGWPQVVTLGKEGRWGGGRHREILRAYAVEEVVHFINLGGGGPVVCSVILILNSNHDYFLADGSKEP